MLRDGNENARRQGHVENAVGFLVVLLQLLEVLLQCLERLVLVVLSGHVCAHLAELRQLLLHILGGGFDV